MSFQRLRTDFHFGIVIFFGVIAVLCIAPFAVYRFALGQPLAGSVDAAIVVCILAGMNYAWRGGNIEYAGIAVVMTSTLGALALIAAVGSTSVPWIYPILVANFLVVARRTAALFSVLAISLVALQESAFQSQLQVVVFIITALVVSGFSFIFAHRTETQRQRLEDLASHDALTGAYNRRAMEHELKIAVASVQRDRIPVGLAVMDLDHFKRINDTYGHEAGDQMLVEFTRLICANTRKGDRLFRFGGEEFVLLLRGTDSAGLRSSTEQLRGIIASQLRYRDDPITVSIGAATLVSGEDVPAWLARADAAMYQAKHDGRNRVVVDDGGVPPVRPAKAEELALER